MNGTQAPQGCSCTTAAFVPTLKMLSMHVECIMLYGPKARTLWHNSSLCRPHTGNAVITRKMY